MIILGIDPGYAIVGWGVIEYKAGRFRTLGYGAITTPASMPMEKRFLSIYQSLEKIVKKYRPEYLSIEKLFFNQCKNSYRRSPGQGRYFIMLYSKWFGYF